jgi:hypothetical protein
LILTDGMKMSAARLKRNMDQAKEPLSNTKMQSMIFNAGMMR